MAYFTGMEDVQAKRLALEALVREWISIMDASSGSAGR
jgi:hypothetical protein